MDATPLYVTLRWPTGSCAPWIPSHSQAIASPAPPPRRGRYDGGVDQLLWDANCALRSKTLVIAR